MVLYGMKNMTDSSQAYGLLALAARETWGWAGLPALERGRQGKPFFPGREERAFNLSHSGPLALCGLDCRPLGVDIQVVKTTYRPALPKRVCSAAELAWLGEGENLWRRFTLLWTLKECVVKRTGEGMTRSIPDIRIPLPRWERPESLLPEETELEQDGIRFHLYAGEDWYASVCGENPPPAEISWRRAAGCPPSERPKRR